MSPQKWIAETNAVGMTSKSGRYGGGTYTHSDIAFKFASWISAEFELYLVREFKRMKEEEQKINELICLSNMENLNAVFINEKIPQKVRLIKLNKIAIQQMSILQDVEKRKLLK